MMDALWATEKATELNPLYALADYIAGHACWQIGRTDEALTAFHKVLNVWPKAVFGWSIMAGQACALLVAGRYDEAIALSRQAQREPGARFSTHIGEVCALAHLGRQDEAAAALGRARSTNPRFGKNLIQSAFSLPDEAVRSCILDGLCLAEEALGENGLAEAASTAPTETRPPTVPQTAGMPARTTPVTALGQDADDDHETSAPRVVLFPFRTLADDAPAGRVADFIPRHVLGLLTPFRDIDAVMMGALPGAEQSDDSYALVQDKFGAAYVLEGDIWVADDSLKISVRLIELGDRRAVWSKQFDLQIGRENQELNSVAVILAGSLVTEVNVHQARLSQEKPDARLTAAGWYYRGWARAQKFTHAAQREAIQFFEHALITDPDHHLSMAALSNALNILSDLEVDDDATRTDMRRRARTLTDRLIEMDPSYAFAWVAMLRCHRASGDLPAAIYAGERAVTLNPILSLAHHALGTVYWQVNRPTDAYNAFDAASKMGLAQGYRFAAMAGKACALVLMERYDEAIEWSRASQREPGAVLDAAVGEICALVQMGRETEAAAVFRRAQIASPSFGIDQLLNVFPMPDNHVRRIILGGLRRAGATQDSRPTDHADCQGSVRAGQASLDGVDKDQDTLGAEHMPSSPPTPEQSPAIVTGPSVEPFQDDHDWARVVAVLPFSTFGLDGSDARLARFLVGNIVGFLVPFRELRATHVDTDQDVASETDLTGMRSRLGAHYVVSGDLWSDEALIRISVRIYETAGKSLVWSERYELPAGKPFRELDETAAIVAAQIPTNIAEHELRLVDSISDERLTGTGWYYRARSEIQRPGQAAKERAIASLERCLNMLPGHRSACATLAIALNRGAFSFVDAKDIKDAMFRRSRLLADELVSRDPTFAFGWVSRAHCYLSEGDVTNAIGAGEKAIALNPALAVAHRILGVAYWQADNGEAAVQSLDRALKFGLAPGLHAGVMAEKACALVVLDRYQDAIDVSRQAQREPGADFSTHIGEICSLAYLGRTSKAAMALAHARKVHKEFSSDLVSRSFPMPARRARAKILEGLRRAEGAEVSGDTTVAAQIPSFVIPDNKTDNQKVVPQQTASVSTQMEGPPNGASSKLIDSSTGLLGPNHNGPSAEMEPAAGTARSGQPLSETMRDRHVHAMSGKPSIVVLPFTQIGEGEPDHLAHGVVHEITAALSRIRDFFVIARQTAHQYHVRDADYPQIGRSLGVRYIVDGTVQRAGDPIRVRVNLVDATTGAQIWTERFDGVHTDLFALNDRIASRVAGAVLPSVRVSESALASFRPTAELDAYGRVHDSRQNDLPVWS